MTAPTQPPPEPLLAPVHPAIEAYLESLAATSDQPVLLAMEARARESGFPIIGRLCGLFLYGMALAIGARRVFEFGSGFGYSAYWFARAVGATGMVLCTDGDAVHAESARQYLEPEGLWPRVHYQTGLAQEIFAASDGLFDICYNDADKGDYPEIWRLARDRIRPGGLYIADNVLWHGRVTHAHPVEVFTGWTDAIRAHNRAIFADPDFDSFINPTRDGVLVARRKRPETV